MLGSKLVLASMITVFLLCCHVQAATTSHWNVPGEGQWGDANSWNPTIVPDNGEVTFDVIIDPVGDLGYYEQVKVGLQDNHRINQLSCFGVVGLEGLGGRFELAVESGLTNYGYLEIEKIEINGNVTNIDGAELCLYNMDIEGIAYNEPGAIIEVEDRVCIESELTSASSFLVNYGTVEIIPYSELWVKDALDNTGEINVYGGICGCDNSFNNPGVIGGFGVIGSGGVFTNYGEITAFGGSLSLWCHSLTNIGTLSNKPLSSLQIDSKYDVWNKGTIYARTGGGVAFVCRLVNDTSGLIELLGGTLAAAAIIQTAGAEFTGFGSIAGNILIGESGARIELTGPTNIIGNVTIAGGATLVISAGQTMITGHTKNDGTILLAGGTVLFTSGYSGSGKIIDNAAPSSEVIIDNGDDGTSSTGSWVVSHISGYYGDSSLYSLENGATYSFEAWVLGGVRKVSFWWTSASNRSTAVSVEIYDGQTLLDTVTVNQQINGGKWNALGYYSFSGKAKVKIISGGGDVTVADAVKFTPATSEIIIDNGDIGTSPSGSWNVSSASGYYGDNSLYSRESGDTYSFDAQILGICEISLWWTVDSNRSTVVSVEIYDGGTWLNTVTVNQQINGGKWNVLGTYSFSDKAQVKIISDGSAVVVADAVKFTPL